MRKGVLRFHSLSLDEDSTGTLLLLLLSSSEILRLAMEEDRSSGLEEEEGFALAMSLASQNMVPRYASMKMAPAGACSVLGVDMISGLFSVSGDPDDALSSVAAAFVGRASGADGMLIGLCIRAYPKNCPDLLAENMR